MIVTAVAAAGEGNLVIGKGGMLPWKRVPADMEHLYEVVGTHAILMGSETARSMLRYKSPLLGRCPVIVLTRASAEEFEAHGFATADNLDDALEAARETGETDLMLLGGGKVYAEALEKDRIDVIELTLIGGGSFEGDTFFPRFGEGWEEVSREPHPADERNPHPYTFLRYERRK